jgi:hypothetical protein
MAGPEHLAGLSTADTVYLIIAALVFLYAIFRFLGPCDLPWNPRCPHCGYKCDPGSSDDGPAYDAMMCPACGEGLRFWDGREA